MPPQRQRSRAKNNRFNPYPSALPDLSGHSHNTYLKLDINVKKQTDNVPRRPLNSFFCFLQEGYKLYNADREAFFARFEIEANELCINISSLTLNKIMSTAWGKFSEAQKRKYKDISAVRKAEYVAMHPNYRPNKRHKGKRKPSQDEGEGTASTSFTPVTTPGLSYASPSSTPSARASRSFGPVTPSSPTSIPPSPWATSRDLTNGSPDMLISTLHPISYPNIEAQNISDLQNGRLVDAAVVPPTLSDAPFTFTFPDTGGIPPTGVQPPFHTPNEQTDFRTDYSSLPPLLDAPGHEPDVTREFMSYQRSGFLNYPLTFQHPDPDTHYTLEYSAELSSRLYPLPFETEYEYDSATAGSSYDGNLNTFSSGSNSYSHSHAGPSNSSHSTSQVISPHSYPDSFNASMNASTSHHSYPSLYPSTDSYPYLYSYSGSSSESNFRPGSNQNSHAGGFPSRSGTPMHGELVLALEATHLQAPLRHGQSSLGEVEQIPIPHTLGDDQGRVSGVNDTTTREDGWSKEMQGN